MQYNEYLGQYLMLTTDNVQLRGDAARRRPGRTVGPAGGADRRPRTARPPYGAYMHPWSTGPDLYFLTTVHSNYNVLLMRTTLNR